MSQRHHGWVRQVAEALGPYCDEVRYLDYRHWAQPDGVMDMEYEIGQAAKLAAGLTDYVIVAKSAGTVVAALAVARRLLTPERCVFAGFPLALVEKEVPETADALLNLPPTDFLHNAQDPLGSAQAVNAYLSVHHPPAYDLRTLPGDTHDYLDFALIAQLATQS